MDYKDCIDSTSLNLLTDGQYNVNSFATLSEIDNKITIFTKEKLYIGFHTLELQLTLNWKNKQTIVLQNSF